MARLRPDNVALCLHDSIRQPVEDGVHGLGYKRYNDYPEERLRQDAAPIATWRRTGRDVYVYFNNDERGYAVANARRLAALTRVATRPSVRDVVRASRR